MTTSNGRWYVLFGLLVMSVSLVILAGTFDEPRCPGLAPMPLPTVAILSSAISTMVLTIMFQAVMLFGRSITIPKVMMGFVSMLSGGCGLMTVGELVGLGPHQYLAHAHPAVLIAVAMAYTALAICFAAIFDAEIRKLQLAHMLHLARERERTRKFNPRVTMDM